MRRGTVLLTVLLLACGPIALLSQQPSQRPLPQDRIAGPPLHKPHGAQQQPSANEPVGKIVEPGEHQGSPQAGESESAKDPQQSWGLSDKIAAIASASAFLQFLALVVTIWIMIVNGRRQLRAHVFPDNITIVDGTMLSPPELDKADRPAVSMHIRNSGQTPAYRVVSWWEIRVIPVLEESTLIVPPLIQTYYTTVGTGCTFNKNLWYHVALTTDEKDEIYSGTCGIYVHGRIEYQDAFKKRRFANFRLVYTGKKFPPVQGAVMNFCQQGNDAN
jgi:hypothetical protein